MYDCTRRWLQAQIRIKIKTCIIQSKILKTILEPALSKFKLKIENIPSLIYENKKNQHTGTSNSSNKNTALRATTYHSTSQDTNTERTTASVATRSSRAEVRRGMTGREHFVGILLRTRMFCFWALFWLLFLYSTEKISMFLNLLLNWIHKGEKQNHS